MALTSGTKLGPYEIQSPLGAGGMGEVYVAHDARLNREVAIKILPGSFSADPDRLQRFAQECRAAGCQRAGGGARERNCPSRSEAGKHLYYERWAGKDSRFWAGEIYAA